jgi:hypothetical protein
MPPRTPECDELRSRLDEIVEPVLLATPPSAAAALGGLAASERERLLLHARGCPSCEELIRTYRTLLEKLAELGKVGLPKVRARADFVQGVLSRIEEEEARVAVSSGSGSSEGSERTSIESVSPRKSAIIPPPGRRSRWQAAIGHVSRIAAILVFGAFGWFIARHLMMERPGERTEVAEAPASLAPSDSYRGGRLLNEEAELTGEALADQKRELLDQEGDALDPDEIPPSAPLTHAPVAAPAKEVAGPAVAPKSASAAPPPARDKLLVDSEVPPSVGPSALEPPSLEPPSLERPAPGSVLTFRLPAQRAQNMENLIAFVRAFDGAPVVREDPAGRKRLIAFNVEPEMTGFVERGLTHWLTRSDDRFASEALAFGGVKGAAKAKRKIKLASEIEGEEAPADIARKPVTGPVEPVEGAIARESKGGEIQVRTEEAVKPASRASRVAEEVKDAEARDKEKSGIVASDEKSPPVEVVAGTRAAARPEAADSLEKVKQKAGKQEVVPAAGRRPEDRRADVAKPVGKREPGISGAMEPTDPDEVARRGQSPVQPKAAGEYGQRPAVEKEQEAIRLKKTETTREAEARDRALARFGGRGVSKPLSEKKVEGGAPGPGAAPLPSIPSREGEPVAGADRSRGRQDAIADSGAQEQHAAAGAKASSARTAGSIPGGLAKRATAASSPAPPSATAPSAAAPSATGAPQGLGGKLAGQARKGPVSDVAGKVLPPHGPPEGKAAPQSPGAPIGKMAPAAPPSATPAPTAATPAPTAAAPAPKPEMIRVEIFIDLGSPSPPGTVR